MVEIISVRFKEGGKAYYFNPNGLKVEAGDKVIIETARGVEFGECTEGNTMVDEMALLAPLRPVLRIATPEDEKKVEENHKKEEKAGVICQQKILEHQLEMKLVDVEYNFEGNKILFFFTAEGRVDFRELVKDLASVFRTRIELRQIGVRDEAKMLGGIGICGRPFCCASFLDDFQPVSIKMAKTQNLSLNPSKISGTCGRLMCCLKYEQDAYEDAVKRAPKMDSLVETPEGVGTVSQVNLLRETVKVRLDQEPEQPRCFGCDQICVVRSGKGKRPEGYELPEPGDRPAQRLRPSAAPSSPPASPHGEEGTQANEERRRNRQQQRRPQQQRPRSDRPRPEEAARPEGGEPRQNAGRSRPPRPAAEGPSHPNREENRQQGEDHHRRHRPRHRKPRSEGGDKPDTV